MLNLIPTGQKKLTLANPNAMSTALDVIANGKQLLRHGRICVLGDAGVGKTTLVRSLLGEEFKKDVEKTQGMDMKLVYTTRTTDKQWREIPEGELPNFRRIADKSIAQRLYKSDKRNLLRFLLNFFYSVCCTNMLVTQSTYKNLLDKVTRISVEPRLANAVKFLVLYFLLLFCASFVGLCWMGIFMEVVELTLFYELRAKGFLRWNVLGVMFGCRTIRKCESIQFFHYFAGFSDVAKNVGVLIFSFLLVSLVVQPCQPKQMPFDDLQQKYVLVGFVPTYVFLCSRGFFHGTLIGWGCRSKINEQNYDRIIEIGTFISVTIMIIFNLDKAFLQILQPPHISGDKEPTAFKRWLFLAAVQLAILMFYTVFGVDSLYLMGIIMITEATIGVVFRCFIYRQKKSQIPGLLSQFRSSELTTLSTHHFILQRHSGFFFNEIQKLLENSDKLRDEEEFISALRFRIQDFAGDEEYYSYHHLFILDQAIFFIVFNLTVDVHELPSQLMFWLSSICAHTSVNQLSVFLVGTHRDEVSDKKLLDLNKSLKSHLLPTFGHMLEGNGNFLFFAVENKHSNSDQGVKSLKQSIEKTTLRENVHLVENEVPLRWLEISQLIQDQMQADTSVIPEVCMRKEDFKNFLASKELTIEDNDEFENMLHYFHRKGLILYVQRKTPAKLNDKYDSKQATLHPPTAIEMSDWLLLNPQILAKAEIEFVVNHDKLDKQEKVLRKDWQVLSETGYISDTLLHHTLNKFSHCNVETLVAFMEVCNLICRLAHSQKQRHGESVLTHFLPARLPRFTKSFRNVLWHNSSHDKQFYFIFHGFLPEAVFHRIVARAYTHSCVFNLKANPQVYRNVGLFWLSKNQCYLLELVEDKGIKVTFATVNSSDGKPSDVMAILWSIVKDVCDSDFKFLKVDCGPACFKCSQRDGRNTCMPRHIIDIYPKCCYEDIRQRSFMCGNIELDKHELQVWFPNT